MYKFNSPKCLRYIFYSIIVALASPTYGFSINPMFIDMQPNGTRSRSVITVTNSSPRPMPVSAGVSELILDKEGKARAIPNNTNFIVFPPRAIIKPHSKQAFRIQWRGAPNLPQGKTFELTVAQILVDDEREKNNGETSLKLRVGMAFGSIINMRAATGQPRPVVQSSRLVRNEKGLPLLETVVSNQSNQNFLMVQADSTVTVFGAQNRRIWSYIYTPDRIARDFGMGTVQPNKSRRMRIPLRNLPDHIARQAKSVKLEIRPSAK